MIEREAAARDRTPTMKRDLTAALAAERPRLVRFCARMAGGWGAAEDLAQETLAEAWRARTKLEDDQGLSLWLNAIARNVCLRWLRARARELDHLCDGRLNDEAQPSTIEELPGVTDELSITLERGELADLLDRALALLPGEARDLLIETYLREQPQSELAARWGLSVGTLRARLHRGRLALRRVLTTDLRANALAAGILPAETSSWQETRIWCPFCGRHRLETTIDRESGEYSYRCVGRCQPGAWLVGIARDTQLLSELASPKAILTRHCLANYEGYRAALTGQEEATCPHCGGRVAVRQWLPGSVDGAPPTPLFLRGLYTSCPTCGPMAHASPWHLTLDTPQAVQFWRRYPRMRALPVHEVEREGRLALVTGFESPETAARLEIVSARDTYEILHVAGELDTLEPLGEARP